MWARGMMKGRQALIKRKEGRQSNTQGWRLCLHVECNSPLLSPSYKYMHTQTHLCVAAWFAGEVPEHPAVCLKQLHTGAIGRGLDHHVRVKLLLFVGE